MRECVCLGEVGRSRLEARAAVLRCVFEREPCRRRSSPPSLPLSPSTLPCQVNDPEFDRKFQPPLPLEDDNNDGVWIG